VTETSEFIGRIQAVDRVALTARVTAFLQQRLFIEGTEVKEGDLLYSLERPPFEATVAQQEASVADASARLANANIQLTRAQSLLSTPAGQRSSVDDATAAQRSQAAQLMGSQAQLRIAQLNLAYTEIHAPIGGKISRTNISVGNVVSPGSGPLASIVSQDPMYVVFPIAVRTEIDLEKRYADQGGMGAVVIRLRLPDGKLYNETGKVDYIEPSVQATTDTILLRGKIANPPLKPIEAGKPVDRPLIDGEFVTVLVEGIQPVEALAVPRAAVLSDQQGDYVYLVDAKNNVEQRRIQLGQSTPSTAVIMAGLKEGDMVVLEGIQRVRPGIQVVPGPAAPTPAAPKPAGQ
jgi:membrane fusion protein (multidrug efflux system)